MSFVGSIEVLSTTSLDAQAGLGLKRHVAVKRATSAMTDRLEPHQSRAVAERPR
jgi:hypothetical protein